MSTGGDCSSGTDSMELVFFSAAGLRFAVDASQIASSSLMSDDQIPPVETLLGFTTQDACGKRQTLLVRLEEGYMEFSAEGPVELSSISEDCFHPLPFAIRSRCGICGLRALLLVDSCCIPLVDLAMIAKGTSLN